MSGSRLGRGRGGRLAVYGGCGVVVLLLVFLYRAATSEMARLRDLHVQCAHQQEALAAQLQVIFEYKVRLEKSLAEEKSSNAAVKQELQQRASREKSLRDKDRVEDMLRFNSLQQTYKLLQTEHQDLQEECRKREKQALEDSGRLESTLQVLRSRLRQASEEREKALQHLKNRYLELETAKTRIEEKYNELLKTSGDTGGAIEHLKKEVFQLKRELEEAKKSSSKATSPGPSMVSPQSSQMEPAAKPGADNGQAARSQQQQVSRPNNDDEKPQPLHAPRAHHAIGDPLSAEKVNEDTNAVRFAQKNGNIVPVGPNEDQRDTLPLPYDLEQRRNKDDGERDAGNEEKDKEEEQRQVIPPPSNQKAEEKSSNTPKETSKSVDSIARPVERTERRETTEKPEEDELQKIQEESTAPTSSIKSIPAVKSETSTLSSSGNPISTAFDKPPAKPASKVKLPVGVVPIPVIIDPKLENPEEKIVKKEEKHGKNLESKEEEGNVEPFPAAPGRRFDEQVLERRGGWFRVAPGVQEIGEELNHPGRLPGLDDGADPQGDAGDDQYEGGDYEKQKNSDLHLVEGEDEGEDEDDQLDYPQNLKQEKRE